MAEPMAGICEVVTAPTMRAMLAALFQQHLPEGLDRHAGLLRADVLHAQAEDAGELGEVVHVAARRDQLEHVAPAYRLALRAVERELAAIGVLVAQELGAVPGAVERVAHLVERVALARLRAVEDHGARDALRHAATVTRGGARALTYIKRVASAPGSRRWR